MPPPRLKRSNTAGSVPASLEDGEIAINQSDGKLYYQTSAGGVASFSALPSVASTMTGVLTVQPAVGPASPDGSLRVIGDNTNATIAIQRHADSNANPSLRFKRTRGTKAAQTVAQSGDSLGAVAWHGVSAEGAEVVGGSIVLQCTAAPVAGDTSLRTQMNISIGGGTLVTTVASFTPTTCNFLNTLAVNGSSVVVTTDSRLSDARIPTDGSVTTAKIADASITTAKIADGAVVTVDIANSAVTYAKIQEVSATDRLLGRSTAGAGAVEEIPCTAFGRTLINDAHATEARATLGLGTAFDGAAGTVSAPTFTFTSDTNTGVYSPGADQWAVTTGGVQRLSISAAGDVGIGVVAAANVRLYTYHTVANTTPTVCHQVIADPVSTVTGAYTTFGAYFVVRVDVAAGVTDSGAKRAMFVSALRNTKTASGTDAGTLLSLRGAEIQYGHSTVNTALTPTTTQVVGLMLAPYNGYGTVTDMYDLFINSDSHAFGAITNHYAIYQASATSRSYFAGSVGIGASRTSPASALDVNGSITVTAGSATSPSICFHSDANNGLFAPAADTLAITTGGVERLRVDAAGDVGIGTTNPSNNLHIRTAAQGFGGITVASPTRTLDVRPDSGAGSNNSIVQSGDTTLIFTAGAQGTGAFVIAPWAGTACGLRMDSSGNVGFGATSPTAPIDVAGNTIRIRTARTPASATATGSVGEVCWDESYLYICTATNTWRRIAHATW